MRRLLLTLLVLAGGLVCLWWVVPTIKLPDDIRQRVERHATASLGRPVTIGSLHVELKNPLYIDATDVRLANPDWASTQDMVRIGHVVAAADMWPLLRGVVRLHKVAIDDAQVVLERNADGTGNWKSDKAVGRPPAVKTPEYLHEVAKENRAQVPIVRDLAVRNSWITFRTSSGQILKIDLNDVKLNTAADDAPVTLTADGGYNGIPVRLDVLMQSFDAMHDVDTPFHADIIAKGAGGIIKLNADMMDPLNFDNFHSMLDARFENLGWMAEIFGTHFRADMPIDLTGAFQHDDMEWHIDGMRGALGDSTFRGDLILNEGPRLHPDAVALGLDFNRLDIGAILKQTRVKRVLRRDKDEALFHVERKPSMLLDLRLGVKNLVYKTVNVGDVKLRAAVDPGRVTLKNVSAVYLGGKIDASLVAQAVGDSSAVTVMAQMKGADVTQVLRVAGINSPVMTGKLDIRAEMTSKGESEDALKKNGRGEVVVGMVDGAMLRKIIEQASVDLGGLFGYSDRMGKLSCMLAVAKLDRGMVTVTPLRIKTENGTLFGGGTVDLNSNAVRFQLRTNPQSTGFFALDLPIAITGSLDKPVFAPIWSSNISDLKAQGLDNVRQLTPDMHDFIAGNGCSQ